MAKSIRSRHEKKMRAIKRVRYEERALKKLKETISYGAAKIAGGDIDMKDAGEVVDYVELKKKQLAEKLKQQEAEGMDDGTQKVFKMRTLKDQHNQFPKWMGEKQQMKQRAKNGQIKGRKSNGRRKATW